MLVLKRPEGGKIVIAHGGQTLELKIGKIGRGCVALEFVANREFQIDRSEVAERRALETDPGIEAELAELHNGKPATF